jgi:hypothetical protein
MFKNSIFIKWTNTLVYESTSEQDLSAIKPTKVYYTMYAIYSCMTDIAKKVKNATQDAEAKIKTEEDHAKGKPSSETGNKAKVKVRDALT